MAAPDRTRSALLAEAAGLRRPGALVGGRRRAPRTDGARARSTAIGEAMAALREDLTRTATTTEDDRARGVHAPGDPRGREGGRRPDRRRLRRLARARAGRRRPAERTTARCSRGCPKAQGRRDLGAVDHRPARLRAAATARASTRPAGTSTSSDGARPTSADRAGWLPGSRALLRDEGLDVVVRASVDRGRRGWPTPWPRCAAGRCRAERDDDATRAVLCDGVGRAAAARARRSSSSARRWARCPTRRPIVPLQRDLDRAAAAAAAQAEARSRERRRSTCARTTPARAAACCTGCACSASDWGKPARRRRAAPAPSRRLDAAVGAGVRRRA